MAIGASAGAPVAAYFLAGTKQSYLGTSIFYDNLRDRKFINPFNIGEIANIAWLRQSFIGGTRKLDTEAVLANRTALYVALTDYIDGSTDLYNTREYPAHIVDMLAVSSAIPVLYRRALMFNGRRYLDGTIAFSVRRTLANPLIASLDPTDILLITNFEEGLIKDTKTKTVERVAKYFSHHFERLLLRRIQLQDDLAYLASLSHPRIGVITGAPTQKSVGQLTTDKQKLWELGDVTLRHVLKSFGREELYKPLNAPA